MIHRPTAFSSGTIGTGYLAAAVLLAGLNVAVLGALVLLAMLVG